MASVSPVASVSDGAASPSTQLRQAAMQGNTTMLSQLLAQHPTHVDGASNSAGQAPLLVAALLGQQHVVELLLSAGANPNRRGKRQETALMLAAQRGHVDVMRVLLTRGASATTVDQRGWTALHFGAFSGQATSVRALLASGAAPKATLLELRTGKGETALALAAFGRKDDACRAMMQVGAKPASIDDAGDRAYAQKLYDAMRPAGAGGDNDGASAKGSTVSSHGLSTLTPPVKRPGAATLGGRRPAAGVGRTPLLTDLGAPGQPLDSPGVSPSARPAIQFSGTNSEFERLITPQHSEAAAGGAVVARKGRSGSLAAAAAAAGRNDSEGGLSPKPPAEAPGASTS